MKSSCDCISKFNEAVRKESGDEKAHLDTFFTVGSGLSEFPSMTYTARPKKKDGTFGKEKHLGAAPSFCPFCGKRYEV